MAQALYLLSFAAGFGDLVARLIKRDQGPDAVRSGDGSVLLIAPREPFKVPAYARSASLVVAEASAQDLPGAYRALAALLEEKAGRDGLARAARDRAFGGGGGASRFVVRGFLGAEPSFPGAKERAALEAALVRGTGFKPDSSRPDLEFRATLREGGQAYLTVPLRGGPERREPRAGELPSETARLLIEMAGTAPDDTFLDPFMGWGAIPMERSLMAPYNMIFCSDSSEACLAFVKERLKEKPFEKRRRTIFPKVLDARDLSRFEDGLFSVLVSDPPWGSFENFSEEDLVALYADFLKEAARVLKADGRMVLLTGRTEALEKSLDAAGGIWKSAENFEVLVSGKKARATRLVRP